MRLAQIKGANMFWIYFLLIVIIFELYLLRTK